MHIFPPELYCIARYTLLKTSTCERRIVLFVFFFLLLLLQNLMKYLFVGLSRQLLLLYTHMHTYIHFDVHLFFSSPRICCSFFQWVSLLFSARIRRITEMRMCYTNSQTYSYTLCSLIHVRKGTENLELIEYNNREV